MPDNHVKPKVLVVDDERVIADTLAMILEPERFSGESRVLRRSRARNRFELFHPDMLIADVIMADLNGIDAAIQIRASAAEDQDPAVLRAGCYCRSARKGAGTGL